MLGSRRGENNPRRDPRRDLRGAYGRSDFGLQDTTSRLLLAHVAPRRQGLCAAVRRVPTPSPSPTASRSPTHFHGLPLAFRAMGNGPFRTIPPGIRPAK
ncbi:unnamed protein product, partial [Musa textilis]